MLGSLFRIRIIYNSYTDFTELQNTWLKYFSVLSQHPKICQFHIEELKNKWQNIALGGSGMFGEDWQKSQLGEQIKMEGSQIARCRGRLKNTIQNN